MAEFIARGGTLKVSDGSESTVGGIVSMGLTGTHDMIDKTDFDSSGYKESEYGETQLKISAEVNLNEADAGQAKILTAFRTKATLTVRYRPLDGTGARQYVATGLVTSFNFPNARNAMGKATFEITLSGTITDSTQ